MSSNLNGPATTIADSIRAVVKREYGAEEYVLCTLMDNSGAVVVLPMNRDCTSNALIFNVLGDVRCHVEIPPSFRGGVGFSDAYYVNNELSVIFVTAGRDFVFVIDERTGSAIRTYETR